MSATETSQRRREGRKKNASRVVRLQLKDRLGNARIVTADLLDVAPTGIGIALMTPLAVGSIITVRGTLAENQASAVFPATVKWCTERINGNFHAGLEIASDDGAAAKGKEPPPSAAGLMEEQTDWYEVMQLSPNADSETIARVYRILAQRYHPDSAGGNKELFLKLCEAHRVLSDPALRAEYDARHRDVRQIHWEIFDRPDLPNRQDVEQRKRKAILEAIYAKALIDPESATMNVMEFEILLGCPREHLEAALWYLRAKGFLKRADNGRFSITVTGFDAVEGTDKAGASNPKLLEGSLKE